MPLKCSEVEGQCPHCGGWLSEQVDEYALELVLYRKKKCILYTDSYDHKKKGCGRFYADPYLLVFDIGRPEDEMMCEVFDDGDDNENNNDNRLPDGRSN